MLNTPARNAIATDSPVRISGVARTSVPDPNAYHDPKAPLKNARRASPIISRRRRDSPLEPDQTPRDRDAEHRPEREHGKQPLPSYERDDRVHEQNRHRREQEPERRLHSERGPHRVRRNGLGHQRAELR